MSDPGTNPPATPSPPASASSSESSASAPETAPPVTSANVSPRSVRAPLAPGQSTASDIIGCITKAIVAKVSLPEEVAELVASWVLSTWLQDALAVFPLLAIGGPAHDAMALLHILNDLCRSPGLVAEFKRSDLKDLSSSFHTILISAPNLDDRAAALLGTLTNPGFIVVEQGSYIRCATSRAIYLGENPTIKRIQNSIHINIIPTNARPPGAPERLKESVHALPQHLEHYRKNNVDRVRREQFTPSGVASETAAVAKALGSCVLDAPELQMKLVASLKAQDHQRRSQQSGTLDALVVEAVLTLSWQQREHAFTREIADEVNRLLGLRGERPKVSPETVGRRLCTLGLRAHRLSKDGNGLTFDKATVAGIQQLAAVYVVEDLLTEPTNLRRSQDTEIYEAKEVVEVM